MITASGPVRGDARGETYAFLGIPFAASPTGDRRWRLPEPPAPWTVVRDAADFGPMCPQYDSGGAVVGDEDCLTLNVWTARAALDTGDGGDGGGRPVMVFIHGGGHEQGGSATMAGDRALYDGRDLAERHGVVVVTINYRLGPFGFLAHPTLTAEGGPAASGNYGMHDQLAALRWVRDNVAAFGGDGARVTVFGQSAGSVSVCRLVASPLAAGLFARAILHSGACVATPLATAEGKGAAVARALGCEGAGDVPACLRGKSTAEIMATLDPIEGGGTETLGRQSYDGVVDGYAVPATPRDRIAAGRHNAAAIVVGSTSAENGRNAPRIATEAEYEAAVRAYFARSGLPPAIAGRALAAYPVADYASPRAAYVALTSDVKFACQARRDARLFAASQAAPVYRYWFDHVPEASGAVGRFLGAFHGVDLPFVFRVLEFATAGGGRYVPTAGDEAVADAMQGYWARFAATGDPNGAGEGGVVAWPRYDVGREPYLRLAVPVTVGEQVRGAQCDFWDGLSGG